MPSILTRHAPLRSLEHALRIYFHIYMRLRGVRCGALGYWRGYVNFSVKIHFVIMDFPCRIRRSRRGRRCLHDKYNLLQGLQLNPPPRSHLLQLKIQPQLHGLSTAARATITSHQHPVELLFWFRVCWGMIDDKSR